MAITKIGTNLIKHAARWMDFIGKLNDKNYRRIEQAGLIPPISRYIDSVNRGTKNIAAKAGISTGSLDGKITSPFPWYKSHLDLQNNRIVADFERPKFARKDITDKLLRALVARHEAYEAVAANRARQIYALDSIKATEKCLENMEKATPGIRARRGDMAILTSADEGKQLLYVAKHPGHFNINGDPAKQTGSHLDLDVLLKERKFLDRLPYRNNLALKKVLSARRRSGETQYLDRAGRYEDADLNPNRLERFNKRNAAEVLKNGSKPVTLNVGSYHTMQTLF